MSSFTFESQGTNTYLVYTIAEDDVIDSMSLGMLTNNKIPGLAAVQFTQMDATKYIKYNVSAHISVKQFFTGPVNKKRLLGVFNGIVDAMLSAEDYMIDMASILLDLDYIFADVSTCETFLICLPIINTEAQATDLGVFFKNIMFGTQFDQTENCDHVAKIMNYLNSTPVFSLADFKQLLTEVENGTTAAPAPVVAKPQPTVPSPAVVATAPAAPAQQPQPAVSVAPVKAAVQAAVKPVAPVAVPAPAPTVPPQTAVVAPKAISNAGTPVVPPVPQPAVQEKKGGLFGLFRSKEPKAAPAPKATPAPKAAPVAAPINAGFAVPGQPTPPAGAAKPNFAVPGQPTPPVGAAKPNFAVPGQPTPTGAPAMSPKPVVQPAAPQAAPVAQPAAPAAPAYQAPVVPQGQSMNFGETTVLGGGGIGETTVLGAAPTAMQPKPHLIRSKNNEKINLDKPVFRIGKEKSYVDYFIGDNTAISRSHANVVSRDGSYFVVDTNSTNHTYVNGAMIQSNVETKLSHGDKIRLANEDFEFKLY